MADAYSRGGDISGNETITDAVKMVTAGPYPLDFMIWRARTGYRDDDKFTPFKKALGSLQGTSGKVLTGNYGFMAYGPQSPTGDQQARDHWNLVNAGGYLFDMPPAIDLEYEIKAITGLVPGLLISESDLRHALRLAYGPGWGGPGAALAGLVAGLTVQYYPIDPGPFIAKADLYINTLHSLSGRWPILYGNPNIFYYVLKHGFPRSWLNCWLWIADWRNNPAPQVEDWDRFFLWQRAGDTPWVGIDKIDENFFPGTRNQLKAVLAGTGSIPTYNPNQPPAPPPAPGPDPITDLQNRMKAVEDTLKFHNL